MLFRQRPKNAHCDQGAEIYGYVRDQVYFDFLEKEGINMEFLYKEGQVIEFTVDLDDVTTLVLNTFIEMYLQPGILSM